MNTLFASEFFTNNRAKLRERLGTDVPIIITGNGQMQQSADEAFPFRQDNNFWYVTGLDAPDLTLVMTKDDTYLIAPELTFEREAFDGVQDLNMYAERSGISTILGAKEGWQQVRRDLETETSVAVLGSAPSHMKRQGIYTLPFRRNLTAKLKRLKPGLTLRDIRTEFALMRCVKQPTELQAIQQAIDITTRSLQEIATDVLPHATNESEIEAELTYRFRKYGSPRHAFPPIVGAGAHTTTLHHFGNDGPIAADDLLILDIGASAEHYSADVARTISRRPITGRKADVYRAVAAAQDYAFSLIKPGVQPLDYEKAVETFIGEQLMKLGVITEPTRENIRHYFPHATSHFLGLDTHDTGDYRAPWQENMVIACEPGIYIPEEGIGVRIEDNVLITADGCKVLSAACPRELTQVQ